ncbi:MAG: hypothetical protein E8D46_08120 [Nitrospira sp.]|nr:hypothetical protein [Nitrospira sp.]TKB74254.1 MAG: hypothetical protein E8D46_08120 [Nitrospira sp.]
MCQADLRHAKLTGANLERAQLEGALLRQANLASVSGLTQPQLDTTCVDEQTTLPAELNRPHPCKTSKAKR